MKKALERVRIVKTASRVTFLVTVVMLSVQASRSLGSSFYMDEPLRDMSALAVVMGFTATLSWLRKCILSTSKAGRMLSVAGAFCLSVVTIVAGGVCDAAQVSTSDLPIALYIIMIYLLAQGSLYTVRICTEAMIAKDELIVKVRIDMATIKKYVWTENDKEEWFCNHDYEGYREDYDDE